MYLGISLLLPPLHMLFIVLNLNWNNCTASGSCEYLCMCDFCRTSCNILVEQGVKPQTAYITQSAVCYSPYLYQPTAALTSFNN